VFGRLLRVSKYLLHGVTVPDMTYNVFSGTLNPAQSIRGVLCLFAATVHI